MAYRCSDCDVSMPSFTSHEICPACGVETWDAGGEYDANWRELIHEAKVRIATGHIIKPIPNCEGPIVKYHGWDWIAHLILIDAGYLCLEDFGIVQINGRFYELQAHIGRYSYRPRHGGWWIEEIDPDTEPFDWPVLEEEPDRG